jgi:hypothetical protein
VASYQPSQNQEQSRCSVQDEQAGPGPSSKPPTELDPYDCGRATCGANHPFGPSTSRR